MVCWAAASWIAIEETIRMAWEFRTGLEPEPIVTSLPMTLPSSSRHPFLTVTERQTTEPRRREFKPM